MSIERFRTLAGTWGADPARWPEGERALYARLADTPEARAILAEAADLDRFLDGFEPRTADPLRPARIVRAAHEQARARRRGVAWASGAWAASAVLGFVLGYMEPVIDGDTTADEAYTQLLTGNTVLEDFL